MATGRGRHRRGDATAYENFTSYGVINVTEVSVTLPTAAKDKVTPATLPPPPHTDEPEALSEPQTLRDRILLALPR